MTEHDPVAAEELALPTAWESLRVMWVFSVLRITVFLALWGLLLVAKVPGFLAAVIALALSIPLSFVLLRKPREKLAINVERRVTARRLRAEQLSEKLLGEPEQDADDVGLSNDVEGINRETS